MPEPRQGPDPTRTAGVQDVEIQEEGSATRSHIDDQPIAGGADRRGADLPGPRTDPEAQRAGARADEQRDEEVDLEREEQRGDLP